MTGVRVRDDESFEKALKRFTKSCEKAGILSDIKKRQHFEKPSEKRKRKQAAARRKTRKRFYVDHSGTI
ncbi:MAG: 30S ribosomal protein S21 [candidate division Zixibacteria bacterium]|nr:30S ribosomal protein S21 [candidate division Zixibacteria bacterium]